MCIPVSNTSSKWLAVMQNVLIHRGWLLVGCSLFVAAFPSGTLADEQLTFNRDIRPILSAACFRCHGMDEKKREAKLRLDDELSAKEKRDEGAAVVPGSLEKSLLWQRITSTDPDSVMPPPDSNVLLTDEHKAILKKWLEQGAVYENHWSLQPLVQPVVPKPESDFALWQKNPIDVFLLRDMRRLGLTPQPEADRHTLVRRAAFTLTGLPPTLIEVDEFMADTSADAYEKMVDRFLEKTAYGEEMARHWLDIARYGDTHGLHLDNVRSIWAYRDWVVKAFNANKPFSDFTIEQLAGDLLPNATKDQKIATGFNRCNVTTSEGGAIKEEFQFRYAVDRASTTVQTWMGLTGGCSVCHDHKYDPLSMREFYSLYAFFYSSADPAMDGNAIDTPPFLSLATPEQEQELTRLKSVEKFAAERLQQVAEQYAAKADPPAVGAGSESVNGEQAEHDRRAVREVWFDDEMPLGSTAKNTSRNAAVWTTDDEMEIPHGRRALKQAFGHYYQEKMDGGLIPRVVPEDVRLSVWLKLDSLQPSRAVLLELATSSGPRRFAWGNVDELNKGEFKDDNNVYMGALPEAGAWQQLSINPRQLNLTAGATVSELTLAQFGGICWWDGLIVSGSGQAANDPRRNVTAWWESQKGKNVQIVTKEVASALKAGPSEKVSDGTAFMIRRDFLQYIALDVPSELEIAREAWTRARRERMQLEDRIPGTMIFGDLPEPRKAHVMRRGQYDQPLEEVAPATPSCLPPLKLNDPNSRPTRLDLAKWLVSSEHPITARVTVNRFWQQLFGVGIVKTSDDFGTQGEVPKHPELLDWLAADFKQSGWNVKRLMRSMVTSAAFKQSAKVDSEVLSKDPENRFLARGPRIRLDAEQVRDGALAVSGLLNPRIGGPGFRGYQPSNIWEPVGYGDSNTRYYLQDTGPDLYRRSLYCFVKRTAPAPFMSNFDAPNREFFCARRERSNTPLQALQLMNDIQNVEASRALAQRVLKEGGLSGQERIRYIIRLVLSRETTPEETLVLSNALDNFSERYAQDAQSAKQLIEVGDSEPSATLDPKELAAYTLLSNLILNLDETVNRN